MKTKTIIKLITPFAIVGVVPTTLLLSSCSNSSCIIFANFESYMSPDVMDRAKANTNTPVQFVWCSTNEEIQSKFSRYYDVAIPSSYEVIPLMQSGQLLPIDYSKFPSLQALGILPPLSPAYGYFMKTSGLLTDTVIEAIDTIDS
jgi:spermidine/putrescine-binding protein